jgi:transcriptional regulator with XRE-family HTH domain
MNDLKKTRRMTGLTQTRAARAAGISRPRLSQAECGEILLTKAEESRLRRVLRRAIEIRAAKMRDLLDGDLPATLLQAGRSGGTRLRTERRT